MTRTADLLPALQALVRTLHADLLARSTEATDVAARLRQLHAARQAEQRSAQSFEAWRDEFLTQVAVGWVLGCVFVRYLEDNRFLGDYFLAGPTPPALDQAKHNFRTFVHETRTPDAERDYLLRVFQRMQRIDAVRELFAPGRSALWAVEPSNAAAITLLAFFQHQDPGSDERVPEWRFDAAAGDTRFLGDLYQDLSEDVRKRYALLQTPAFVEAFILDRTLEPAVREFGSEHVRLIDPTCGSGHFLLGAFGRQFARWEGHWQRTGDVGDTNRVALAQRALDQVYGVDLNPYAVAICRFRLVIAALTVCGLTALEQAPGWRVNVTVGDSLIHGRRFSRTVQRGITDDSGRDYSDPYDLEDPRELNRILGQQYHAVVGNPPYITVKDRTLNERYRELYDTCYRQFSLAVPFMERFFDLALPGENGHGAGYVGQICANSFMKREFGRLLIEQFLAGIDLTHVVNTDGAYIPGHGTPTVILFGRNRKWVEPVVRAVLSIRGEPGIPGDPAKGKVWLSILELIDQSGKENGFVGAVDLERARLATHPWSMGGGGLAELKVALETVCDRNLRSEVGSIGFYQDTHADEVFVVPSAFVSRHGPGRTHLEGVTGTRLGRTPAGATEAPPCRTRTCPSPGTSLTCPTPEWTGPRSTPSGTSC